MFIKWYKTYVDLEFGKYNNKYWNKKTRGNLGKTLKKAKERNWWKYDFTSIIHNEDY